METCGRFGCGVRDPRTAQGPGTAQRERRPAVDSGAASGVATVTGFAGESGYGPCTHGPYPNTGDPRTARAMQCVCTRYTTYGRTGNGAITRWTETGTRLVEGNPDTQKSRNPDTQEIQTPMEFRQFRHP
jgi:hypothetical protein